MIDHLKENNLLIAEFMGYKKYNEDYPNSDYYSNNSIGGLRMYDEDFSYHEEWSWIMPVVEKIENMGIVNFVEITKQCCIISTVDKRYISLNSDKKLAIFESIIKFLKDYKKNGNK